MRILFIGDIVGKPGVDITARCVHGLRSRESLSLVVANAENADAGSGITPAIYRRLKQAGVDCITLGDHIYRKRDIIDVLREKTDILRPANFPPDAPGVGWTVVASDSGRKVAVISLIGRVFMKPVDCPFRAADQALAQIPDDVVIRLVDIHAEATSDKQLIGRYLDGRVSAVLGTHTHVTTADQQILPGGTAFQCDVGMTGPHDSILGRETDRVMETTISFRPRAFSVAKGDNRLSGTIVDIDPENGKALRLQPIKVTERDARQLEEMT